MSRWTTSKANGRIVVDANGNKVATASATPKQPAKAWHNAKLIAAAPELLDACAAAASAISEVTPKTAKQQFELQAIYLRLQAVIEEATR